MNYRRNPPHIHRSLVLVFLNCVIPVLGISYGHGSNFFLPDKVYAQKPGSTGQESSRQTGDSVFAQAEALRKQESADSFRRAVEMYLAAAKLYAREGNRASEALAFLAAGFIAGNLGEQQKALEYYSQALPLRRAVGDRGGEATTLSNIGLVYSDLAEQQKALEYYSQALPLRRAVGDRGGEATTLNNLMLLFEKENPRLAILYGKESVNRYQGLRANIQGLDKSIQQTYRQSIEGNYRGLSSILISQGRIPEAEAVRGLLEDEEYFKHIRRDPKTASALGRRLDLTKAEAEAIAEYSRIGDQLTAIGTELTRLEEQRLKLPETAVFPRQARLDELRKQLAAGATAMQVFFRQKAEEFSRMDVRVTSIASGLQARMRKWGVTDAVVITAYTEKESLSLVVTTPSTQAPHIIEIKEEELNRLVVDFRRDVTDPCACRSVEESGRKLYDILIKPLEQDIKGANARTLLWLMDGVLTYVPVAALWDGKQYLAERYDNVALSFNYMDNLTVKPQPVRNWRGLGVGVSKGWPGFSALPAVQGELTGIIREENEKTEGVLPGRRLLDADFTRENWERALGRYALIHVASHFSFSPGNEGGSNLLLGDGTAYTLEEVTTRGPIFSGVEQLTLSACNTAMGESNGREIKGFGRLAQEQGALSVLATLWAVADESTAKLMREYYRRLVEPGMTKARALTMAQMALLSGEIKSGDGREQRSDLAGETKNEAPTFKTDPKRPYAHPYYWAPFILIGNWK